MILKTSILLILLFQIFSAKGQYEDINEYKNTIKAIAYLYPIPDPLIFHWAIGYERNISSKYTLEIILSKLGGGEEGYFGIFSSHLGIKHYYKNKNKLLNNCFNGLFFRYQYLDYKSDWGPRDYSTNGYGGGICAGKVFYFTDWIILELGILGYYCYNDIGEKFSNDTSLWVLNSRFNASPRVLFGIKF